MFRTGIAENGNCGPVRSFRWDSKEDSVVLCVHVGEIRLRIATLIQYGDIAPNLAIVLHWPVHTCADGRWFIRTDCVLCAGLLFLSRHKFSFVCKQQLAAIATALSARRP
jgi:hypothetical protein